MDLSSQSRDTLAIFGGEPTRKKKMPPRMAFGPDEEAELLKAIQYYRNLDQDPPYSGYYEKLFCDAFCEFMGGGYADAVSAGTAAIYVGLRALQLPAGSDVIVSPVTDSSLLNCVIEQGHNPVLADSKPDSYNIGVQQFLDRITPNTRALLCVHAGGEPLEIDVLVEAAHQRGIKVLEDCSQAIGARWKGKCVGTFGDVAAFSTMYRKNLAAGASSGILYTPNEEVFKLAQSYADRGKPVWRTDIDLRNPGYAFFPALNWNTDDLSCAIGLANLRRLEKTNEARRSFLRRLISLMAGRCRATRPFAFHEGFSPFYFPIFVDEAKLSCSKMEFAKAMLAEGIGLGEHYGCLISTWPWAQEYLSDDFVTENAISTRDRCFHLYVNENYGEQEAVDCVNAMVKIENYYLR